MKMYKTVDVNTDVDVSFELTLEDVLEFIDDCSEFDTKKIQEKLNKVNNANNSEIISKDKMVYPLIIRNDLYSEMLAKNIEKTIRKNGIEYFENIVI